MTDTSREAVERHLNLDHNHEAGLIPAASQAMIRTLLAERDNLQTENARLRKALTDIDELGKRGVGCGGIARAALNTEQEDGVMSDREPRMDLFSQIKQQHPPEEYDLLTAEGRAAWDRSLREFINDVYDPHVRQHLCDMVEEWRLATYKALNKIGEQDDQ